MNSIIQNPFDTASKNDLNKFKEEQGKFNAQIFTVLTAIEAEIDFLRKQIEQLKPKENTNGTADTENKTEN